MGKFLDYLRECEVNEAFDTNKENIVFKRRWEKGFNYHMVKSTGTGTNMMHLFFSNESDMRKYFEENKPNWKGAQFYLQKDEDFENAKRIK